MEKVVCSLHSLLILLCVLVGKSWIMAITKTQKYIFRDEEMPDMDQEPGNPPRQSILGESWACFPVNFIASGSVSLVASKLLDVRHLCLKVNIKCSTHTDTIKYL